MFEAWLSDLLASYLGHFLDVKPEALRVSLWKGESLGVVGAGAPLAARPSLLPPAHLLNPTRPT